MPPRRSGPRRTKPCEYCRKLFAVEPSQYDKRRHCSRACWKANINGTPEIACETCGKRFVPCRANWLRGYGRYCGFPCSGAARRKRNAETTEARFWARVDKSGDCWVWTGARYKKGYGRFSVDRETSILATHYAWKLEHGPIPPGMLLCHRCDRPECCRVDHLFLGTAADNTADMIAKGRHTIGTRNANAVLTDDIVREARRRYAARETTLIGLAREYGVKVATLRYAVSGRGWSHVTP